MWERVNNFFSGSPPKEPVYRSLYEHELSKSTLWLEALCKATKTMRMQQKGLQRQARRMNRIRAAGSKEQRDQIARLSARNTELSVVLGWLNKRGGLGYDAHKYIENALAFTGELPADFSEDKDLKEASASTEAAK